MSYKIAIASTDGKVVNEHFGRAEKFLIIEVNDQDQFQFIESRNTEHSCNDGTHDEQRLYNTVLLLSDCRYVLVGQIGPGAEYALSKYGVTAFAIKHYIEDAVNKLIQYNRDIKITK